MSFILVGGLSGQVRGLFNPPKALGYSPAEIYGLAFLLFIYLLFTYSHIEDPYFICMDIHIILVYAPVI